MNSIPKILFLLHGSKIVSGGHASAMELSEALIADGFDVHIGLISFDPFYLLRRKNLIKHSGISLNNIHYIPGYVDFMNNGNTRLTKLLIDLKNCFVKPSKNNIRRFVEAFLGNSRVIAYGKFEDCLSRTDIIIKIIDLTGEEFDKLKSKTNALFVLNHAGSPQTFEEYWLTEKHKPVHTKPELSLYVNYCLEFDRILFQSEDQASECASRNQDLKERVITINPTCNESEIIDAKSQKSPYAEGITAIVNVGSIQPRKDQLSSIAAFATLASEFPKTELHFIGGFKGQENYFLKLRQFVNTLGLSKRVFFHGHRRDHLRFMTNACVLLQSSKSEGVSRVLREAMFMKLPIVSFSIPGTNSILKNDVEALLVPPEDVQAMGRAIASILENPQKSARIAESAYQRYQLNHSNAVYKSNLRKMVDDLLYQKNKSV